MMSKIRCTVCGSYDVEVRTFVKPNSDCECTTNDFEMLLQDTENCYCCECGEATTLKYFTSTRDVFEDKDLYQLMVEKLNNNYTPENYEDDTIYELAHEEYLRVRQEVCLEYGFDEDKYMDENGGETPFDEYDDAIRQEVYKRIQKANTIFSEEERLALWHKGEQDIFISSIELYDKHSGKSLGGADDLFFDMVAAKTFLDEYEKDIEPSYLDNKTIMLEIRKLDDSAKEKRYKYSDVQSIFDTYDFLSLPTIYNKTL